MIESEVWQGGGFSKVDVSSIIREWLVHFLQAILGARTGEGRASRSCSRKEHLGREQVRGTVCACGVVVGGVSSCLYRGVVGVIMVGWGTASDVEVCRHGFCGGCGLGGCGVVRFGWGLWFCWVFLRDTRRRVRLDAYACWIVVSRRVRSTWRRLYRWSRKSLRVVSELWMR